uniref:glucose-6-phosphatase n=1 Tax=Arion vulgaris TaxID=1028688 RepID=A0A0B6Z7U8_9EUPU
MDSLHIWGIAVIQNIQTIFQDYSGVMMFLSYIGDPRFAFIFYFPVGYILHCSVGKRVMWVAVITEWLNAVAKWLLHGERPYWWVHESDVYSPDNVPHLQQFEITCETGPGSPSGHAMITGAVWYILVSDFLYYRPATRLSVRISCWAVYFTGMCCIAVSRLFIATHFPHQVVAGILAGILLGKIFNSLSTSALKFHHYAIVCFSLTVCTAVIYTLVKYLASDPMWSLASAVKWCAHKEWVHLDTTVFYSLLRDVSSLLGLGMGVWLRPEPEKNSNNMFEKCLHIIFVLAVTMLSEGLKPSSENILLFYILGFIKHTVTVVIVVAAIPFFKGLITIV